jgi:hypothetical protein
MCLLVGAGLCWWGGCGLSLNRTEKGGGCLSHCSEQHEADVTNSSSVCGVVGGWGVEEVLKSPAVKLR